MLASTKDVTSFERFSLFSYLKEENKRNMFYYASTLHITFAVNIRKTPHKRMSRKTSRSCSWCLELSLRLLIPVKFVRKELNERFILWVYCLWPFSPFNPYSLWLDREMIFVCWWYSTIDKSILFGQEPNPCLKYIQMCN